jgi:cytochrome c peroxidase
MRLFVRTILCLGLTSLACGEQESFTDWEWEQLQSLSPLPDPPPDHSNKYVGNADAIALGQKLYFDPQFSGPAQLWDMLGRDIPFARAPLGEEVNISCNSCHQADRGGADFTSVPGHVSMGVGAYDVNGQQTYNSAYYPLLYWNGRNDSLWSQIVAVAESDVSMGGDRMKVAWRLADAYRAEYEAVFGEEWPLPDLMDTVAEQKARLNDDGTCKLVDGLCPETHCREMDNIDGVTFCLPRLPLRGKPGYDSQIGYVDEGTLRTCHRDMDVYPAEPFNDNYDCMALADQKAITRIYVNFAKAIAAYEYTLISRDAAFDRFVAEGPGSELLSASAKRGAKLFVGKASCTDCHNTPLFSDGDFHNIGIPQLGEFVPSRQDCPEGGWCDCTADDVNQPNNCLPWGARDGIRKLQSNKMRRDSFYSDDNACQQKAVLHNDPNYYLEAPPEECDGRVPFYSLMKREGKERFLGQWKTPSLRDVGLTGPYMHNGMYATLEQVIWHYNGGAAVGGGDLSGRKDARMQPIALTDAEISDLVAFLKSLTGAPLPAAQITTPTLPAPSPF